MKAAASTGVIFDLGLSILVGVGGGFGWVMNFQPETAPARTALPICSVCALITHCITAWMIFGPGEIDGGEFFASLEEVFVFLMGGFFLAFFW